jgi:hypothetical protein
MAYATIIWVVIVIVVSPIPIMVADVVIVVDDIWIFTDDEVGNLPGTCTRPTVSRT